jgi:hypothetical protein
MARVAPAVPDETSILCENCGYTLDGLPPGSNCPECGSPMSQSIDADGRHPSAWEAGGDKPLRRFASTTWQSIVRPSHFFRTLTTRERISSAKAFAEIHWCMAAFFFATAAVAHWSWYTTFIAGGSSISGLLLWVILLVGTYVSLRETTKLAAWLTAWEARYRGIRLPKPVVLRGLYYHAAHYLPVGLFAFATTVLNHNLFRHRVIGLEAANAYLWILSGQVVASAVYLFGTYWAAMRNMMYANR